MQHSAKLLHCRQMYVECWSKSRRFPRLSWTEKIFPIHTRECSYRSGSWWLVNVKWRDGSKNRSKKSWWWNVKWRAGWYIRWMQTWSSRSVSRLVQELPLLQRGFQKPILTFPRILIPFSDFSQLSIQFNFFLLLFSGRWFWPFEWLCHFLPLCVWQHDVR